MTPRTVEPLPVPSGPAALDVLDELRRALAGEGPARWPVPPTGPDPDLVRTVAPGTALAEGEDDPADPTALLLATSGSTGDAKVALLPAGALAASAAATERRLDGPGHWLLALPAHHVAGVQVLARALAAGTRPWVVDTDGGFRPEAFAETAGAMLAAVDGPGYVSLVPTQLVRLLDADGPAPGVGAALRGFAAVLLGGAPASAGLLARAREAGVRVVTTYGSSETCGGCVYDGVPLDVSRVRVAEDGRVLLGGRTVARGYRGDPGRTARAFAERDGVRWFRTDDTGGLEDGLLRLTGRVDDVINTGGLKVRPTVVEDALAGHPAVAASCVVGVDDPQWGQRVVAAVVPYDRDGAPTLDELRRHVKHRLPAAAAPRQLLVLDAIPQLGIGKPDRRALRRLAVGAEGAAQCVARHAR